MSASAVDLKWVWLLLGLAAIFALVALGEVILLLNIPGWSLGRP